MKRSSESESIGRQRRTRARLNESVEFALGSEILANPSFEQSVLSPIGRRVGNFRIRSFLGSGAFGVVYVADEPGNPNPVALKIPRPEVLLDAEKRKRFASEVALVTQLDHPHIVAVRQAIAVGSQPFIATELCDGPDLGQWMRGREVREANLPCWQDSVLLIASLAEALDHAHQQGISHCDLKPANILLASKAGDSAKHLELAAYDGRVTDFGLANVHSVSFRRSRSSMMVGTPMYMAPEQLDRDSAGGVTNRSVSAADIYSLGVILFELLTGKTPVEGDAYYEVIRNIRTMPASRLRQARPDLPADLDRIVSVCLRKNPEARYDSAADLAKDLRSLLSQDRVLGKRYGLVQQLRHWCRQPERMETAGRFAIWSQLLLTLWLLFSWFFMQQYAVVSEQDFQSICQQALVVILLAHLPLVWLGRQTFRGKRWAAWAGAALTLVNLPAVVWAIVNEPLLFRELYMAYHPYFTFANHSLVLLCFAPQLVLFVVAIVGGWERRSVLPAHDAA